ncbi:hypothetical protein BDU57DRAFT_509440 [Ampelomyces quisqualis]|uniref:Uncharacterized protein n=1 Tax=Ampelomyces quisqualis TaxID=50730 RepID=A0A6A5R1C5_AMPQU|nr:hypothetical protein BDU57DRAFT_509440 [Ampelomyces quisqualis]
MSTAHACFRSALTQAFRPSNGGTIASYSVASFLVPAVSHTFRRSITSTSRRSKNNTQSPDIPITPGHDAATYRLPPKPANEPPESCIPFPRGKARNDIQQWLAAIDPYLPANIRQDQSDKTKAPATLTSIDLALVINAAQDASVDILSYLGLMQGRWAAVTWMAKKLVEDGQRLVEPPVQLGPSTNIIWPELEHRSLKHLTESAIRTARVRPSRKLKHSLDDLTSAPDTIERRHIVLKRALGQLWRTLGGLILASADRPIREDPTMLHVLNIIAHLHHVGLIPDSVYTYHPHENKYALQQPPTIHMLSSKILTALSDASWKVHEASLKSANTVTKTSYFLGQEIPGSRYKITVQEVTPELWLEFVLWSCLHGGWTSDGIAILESLVSRQEDHSWGLISWREIMLAEQQNAPAPSRAWNLFPMTGDAAATAEDRARTHRTISSEIVTAFVDALVNNVQVGVGFRGFDPEVVTQQLKLLKGFLDLNNLSLGSISWDSIMARLLESGAFVPEKRPEALLQLFGLATGFGAEINTVNTSATIGDEVPYFFEPTTIPLSVLHRTMRAFIDMGDTKGAMATLILLQQHTDENKQKSLQQFFDALSNQVPREDEPITNRLPPIEFPAFDTNMPVSLRARLLDLVTEAKLYDLGRWFLFAPDIDGPLIGRELYNHRNIAASIIRFGTLAGENDLVLDIVTRAGMWNDKHKEQRMPAEVLTALLCSQLKLRRWESVQSMQEYIAETSCFKPRPIILSTFAAELLRLSNRAEEEVVKAQDAFSEMLFAWEDLIMVNMRNELYCILAIMSTTDDSWKAFCSQFLALSLHQNVRLSADDFNHVLRGILDGYGSSKAVVAVKTWCHLLSDVFEARRASGGLLRMPRFQVGKGEEYEGRPPNMEIVQDSGAKLVLQGRIIPNRQTIWAILRKVQEEVDYHRHQGQEISATERAEARDTLQWAARVLGNLGYDYEDIVRDMGDGLVELAELEAPVAADDVRNLLGVDTDIALDSA